MPEISVQDLIRQEATKQGVPPELALAVAEQESGFNPTLTSPKGAIGTMQLLPTTAATYQLDPNDPVQNIQGGVRHLKTLLDQYQGDLPKVLTAYNAGAGAVESETLPEETQQYIPSVLGRMPKFSKTPPAATTPVRQQRGGGASFTAPPKKPYAFDAMNPRGGPTPKPASLTSLVSGFDPRTSEGRNNLVGGAAGLAAAYFTDGIAPWMVRVLGPATAAGVAGATEAAAEHATGLADATAPSPTRAGVTQAGAELAGQATIGLGRKIAKPLAATVIARNARQALADQLATHELSYSHLLATPPSVEGAGQAVKAVVAHGGPAARALDAAGQRVNAAAEAGPPVNLAPVKAALNDMAAKARPAALFAAKEQPEGIGFLQNAVAKMRGAAASAKQATTEEVSRLNKIIADQLGVSEQHPLPGLLGQLQNAPDEVSFTEAHQVKRLLDEAVNWDQVAKKHLVALTKGVRTSLRETMRGFAPYDAATEAYAQAAPLYRKGIGKSLIKNALERPDRVAATLKESAPTDAAAVRDLLVGQSTAGGDTAAGQQAWDAVRQQFTYQKVLKGGVDGLADRVHRVVEQSPEFAKVVYSDRAAQQQLTNLESLGRAAQQTLALADQLKGSSLGPYLHGKLETDAANMLRAATLGPTSIWGGLSLVRLLKGPASADLLNWMTLSPARTKRAIGIMLSPTLDRSAAAFFRQAVHAVTPEAPAQKAAATP